MVRAGWGAYEPERDTQGSMRAQQRDERRRGALPARAGHRDGTAPAPDQAPATA